MKIKVILVVLGISCHLFSSDDYKAPKADILFNDFAAKIIDASQAETSINRDVYDYVLDYKLYENQNGPGSKYGESESYFRGEWNKIENDIFDSTKKEVIISGVSELGQLHRGRPFVRYTCSVVEYEKQGVSRGQYSVDIEFLKSLDGKVLIVANSSEILSSDDIIQDVNFTMKNDEIIVDYPDQYYSGELIRKKIVISLNETLDCTLHFKTNNMKDYQKVAFFVGGAL